MMLLQSANVRLPQCGAAKGRSCANRCMLQLPTVILAHILRITDDTLLIRHVALNRVPTLH